MKRFQSGLTVLMVSVASVTSAKEYNIKDVLSLITGHAITQAWGTMCGIEGADLYKNETMGMIKKSRYCTVQKKELLRLYELQRQKILSEPEGYEYHCDHTTESINIEIKPDHDESWTLHPEDMFKKTK